jgi:hypothetical protein
LTWSKSGRSVENEVHAVAPTPERSRWSPLTWARALRQAWQEPGAVDPVERRAYWFWLPTIVLVLVIELLGALSQTFDDAIPWPTISGTIGHLEKRWDWIAVIVVASITMVAFHALAYKGPRTDTGRTRRSDDRGVVELPWYNWLLVVLVTGAAIGLAIAFDATKFEYGYVIYGVLAGVGLLVPGILAFAFDRVVSFPTLFFTLAKLRLRLHVVATVLVTGLAILGVHLAFYPWPDITHESASFAGLNAAQAQSKAERELAKLRAGKPPLAYSTQARGVVDGADAWFVYFRSGCVMTVTAHSAAASTQCSR